MIKFAVLNDLHLADNPPIGRRAGYVDRLFEKLMGVSKVLAEKGIDELILTGDIFHLKRQDRVSYGLTNHFIDWIKGDAQCHVTVAPGNHDLSEAGIDSLFTQPLGALWVSEAAAFLIKDDSWYHFATGRTSVLFVGRHFDTMHDTDPEHYLITEKEAVTYASTGSNVLVEVAHGSIVPPGEKPIYDHIQASAIPWSDGGLIPDLLLCGHLHEDWGIHKVAEGPIYANLGSFGRPSRNQYVDHRDFLIVTIDDNLKIKLEREQIPNMLPADEVFLEKVEEQEDEALAEFAEQLASSILLEDQPIDEALASLGDIPVKVRDRLKKYLEDAAI